MSELNQQDCQYDDAHQKALNLEEIDAYLVQLPNWTYDSHSGTLHKQFSFKNYYHVISFVNAIAFIANKEAHHPDLTVSYDQCGVTFTTHDSGNQVTLNDLICAAKVEALDNSGNFGPKSLKSND
ncbi:MAG: 4a-hydroxytetrahydrobiopterin dehydratase [Pseudomonadota bacterium]